MRPIIAEVSTPHSIETITHGRYLVEAPNRVAQDREAAESDGPYPLLVGFHGYRENAEIQLGHLRDVIGDRRWIAVSVQGLSRFYARGDQDVVAAWMTRQDRELVIADNIAYVAAVLAEVRRAYRTTGTVVYAGFSQGSAMAYRAAAFAGVPSAGLIALAGDVPPDVQPMASALPPVLIGRGTGDLWYTEARARADVEVLRSAGATVTEHVFDDGHVWHRSFIDRASRFLDEVSNRA